MAAHTLLERGGSETRDVQYSRPATWVFCLDAISPDCSEKQSLAFGRRHGYSKCAVCVTDTNGADTCRGKLIPHLHANEQKANQVQGSSATEIFHNEPLIAKRRRPRDQTEPKGTFLQEAEWETDRVGSKVWTSGGQVLPAGRCPSLILLQQTPYVYRRGTVTTVLSRG